MGTAPQPKTKEEEKKVIENLKALCMEVLQPLRDYLGKPVVISSGYRSEEVNRAVGGVKGSQHLKGEAADIHVEDTEHLLKIMHFIMDETDFDRILHLVDVPVGAEQGSVEYAHIGAYFLHLLGVPQREGVVVTVGYQ